MYPKIKKVSLFIEIVTKIFVLVTFRLILWGTGAFVKQRRLRKVNIKIKLNEKVLLAAFFFFKILDFYFNQKKKNKRVARSY